MSDVIVTVVESNTNVTVTEQDVAVAVTENTVQVSASTAGLQGVPGANNDPVYVTVRNATGALLPKGSIVYTSGGNGTHTQVSKALATGDATSARTLGWLSDDIANNADGLCMVEGYLDGVNTQGVAEGAQLYLSGTTAGAFQVTKPVAPIHLVYVGVCVKASSGNGRVYVKVQNGYELDEIHDVLIVAPQNNQVLTYDSATQLWKNATNTPDGVTSITAVSPLTGGTITSTGSIGLNQSLLSITRSQISDFTSGTVTSASTAQQAGTAVYSVNSGTAVYATTSGTATTISGNITRSQVSDFTAGTVAQAGTATYAVNSGTAIYADTSGTAVSVSGSAITQSQVVNLTTDLANTAKLNTANTFTVGGHIVANSATGVVPLVLRGTSGQTARLFEIQDSASTALTWVGSAGQIRTSASIRNIAMDSVIATLSLQASASGNPVAILRGAVGQTADLQQWQTSDGSVRASISAFGLFAHGSPAALINNSTGGNSRVSISTVSTLDSGLTIRAVASQTADILQIQNSANNVIARIDSVGDITARVSRSTFAARFVTTDPSIAIQVNTGAASQTGDFFQTQTSTGTVMQRLLADGGASFAQGLATIGSGGIIRGIQVSTANDLATIREANSGGFLRMTRQTAALTNPGANLAGLYFRDGTNAGTLKLVVRAGAAGAETTILDNIPQ